MQALCASAVVACAVRSEPHLMDHLSERAATAGPQPGNRSISGPDKQRLMHSMQVDMPPIFAAIHDCCPHS